ncbi:MAG TPA: acylneuraminate cytidylyltransferase family protein [Flavobacterium sp.]|jgi:CMP-N-acetylneuraminic acid synthetase
MRILGIIPARGGSKGVPGKNIKLLNGRPLLDYTASVALKSALLTDVILSTDDDAIAEAGERCGLKVPFMRPAQLAQDDTPTIDVIVHAIDWFANKGISFDALCLLQVTSPLRTTEFLEEALLKFSSGDFDSLISVRKVPHEYNPHWVFEKNQDGSLKIATGDKHIIPRRQQLPDAYHRDGSIYITKTATIKQQNSIFGDRISFIESPTEFHINIDTEADWEKAEKLVRNFQL